VSTKYVAFVEGGDDSQRFFTKRELNRTLNAGEKKWFKKAKPGDMIKVANGGYFPGTEAIVIKLSGSVATKRPKMRDEE